jgi:NAD+ synthase
MTDTVSARTSAFQRDGAELRAACTSFVRTTVDDASADGVVVELDGGLESSAVATVAVEALGSERVYGLVLPSSKLGSKAHRTPRRSPRRSASRPIPYTSSRC